MIAIGLQGLVTGRFTTVWQPVPPGAHAREALVYLCDAVSLASGIGLLFRRAQAVAAGALLALLVVWLVVWRVRALYVAPLIQGSWSLADTMVMTAGALVLFARFAVRGRGMRVAQVLYGLGMIPFGYAHFANLKGTASLVPAWLPYHTVWACVTGGAFVAAGIAILIDRFARWAAALSALQMGLFGLLVWVPILASGRRSAGNWMEFATTVALTCAGRVVAESYGRR